MKNILTLILVIFIAGCTEEQAIVDNNQFVFIKITENIQPLDRAKKYEDPLNEALTDAGVGEVTGGGSLLSAPDKDGKRTIEWVGIDVELTDFKRGISIIKSVLTKIDASRNITLEYSRNGTNFIKKIN